MSAAFSRHTTMQTFIHNHNVDYGLNTFYLPWGGGDNGSTTATDLTNSYVVPFWMRLEAVVFKWGNFSDANANFTVGLHTMRPDAYSVDNHDTVAITANQASRESVTVKFEGDDREVSPGKNCLISITFAQDPFSSAQNVFATSVWTVAHDLNGFYNVDS